MEVENKDIAQFTFHMYQTLLDNNVTMTSSRQSLMTLTQGGTKTIRHNRTCNKVGDTNTDKVSEDFKYKFFYKR